jgi:hypothetical protein
MSPCRECGAVLVLNLHTPITPSTGGFSLQEMMDSVPVVCTDSVSRMPNHCFAQRQPEKCQMASGGRELPSGLQVSLQMSVER